MLQEKKWGDKAGLRRAEEGAGSAAEAGGFDSEAAAGLSFSGGLS
jgi:hypothetical protein